MILKGTCLIYCKEILVYKLSLNTLSIQTKTFRQCIRISE